VPASPTEPHSQYKLNSITIFVSRCTVPEEILSGDGTEVCLDESYAKRK
jgi:hypothetical protein